MNLVIDIQTLQGPSRFRGIGRATLEIISSISKELPLDSKLFLLFNSIREIPIEIRKQIESLNVELVEFYPFETEFNQKDQSLVISERIKSMVVNSLSPDMYIGPNIFEASETAIYAQAISGLKCATFFYDAIPLQFPDVYLPTPILQNWYESCVRGIKSYDLVFALSAASRAEGIDLIKLDPVATKYISGGFSEKNRIEKNTEDVKASINFLYFGAFDARKNVPLLLKSFAELLHSKEIDVRLVLAGHVQDYNHEILPLENLAKKLNIWESIEFKGFILDSEIEGLYRNADVYVQTSIAEGLGLGLLDAVAYGVPAIACKIESAREVLGSERYLFENNTQSLTKIMRDLAISMNLRYEFSSRQYDHARKMNWKTASERILSEVSHQTTPEVNSPLYNLRKSYNSVLNEFDKLSFVNELDQKHLAEVIALNFHLCFQKINSISHDENQKPRPLIIEGHFEGSYSLAILNRELTSALKKLSPNSQSREIHFQSEEIGFRSKGQINIPPDSDGFIVTRNTYPPLAHDMKGSWNFFHCFNWEETEFPSKYVMEFNYFLDGVTCASSEVQKALIDSGVQIPTQIVPLSRNMLKEKITPVTVTNSEIVFLHISSGFPRKGIDVLLRAFEAEFKNTPDVLLIIKTFPNPHQNVRELILSINSLETQKRIKVIEEDYSEEQIQGLYSVADCLVQPSRGEGFGLPILEALSHGVKVVATKWGGHLDFYTEAETYGINYEMTQSSSHVSSGKSLWAEPNLDDLKLKIRKVYEEGKYLKKNQTQISSWEDSAQKHSDFISTVISMKKSIFKVAWVSSWDTKCGIAEYSFDLIRNFESNLVKVFAPYDSNPLEKNSEIEYLRAWSPGIGTMSDLVEGLIEYNPSIIVIQFNLGFFSLQQMRELLNETEDFKRIVEVHSLRDSSGQPHKNFVALLPQLLKVDRLLVHNLQDLQFLHDSGLSRQAVLFSHPMPNFGYKVSHRIDSSKKIIIGTSGFSLPHKGHAELIGAIDLLTAAGMNVELRMFTPEHPDPSSRKHLVRISKLIQENPQLSVNLNEIFHTEEDLIALLANCDLLVYPHQVTGEAASGTVQHGLASGRPVLVTPSSIFADSQECLYFTTGFDSTNIAESISNLISKLIQGEERLEIENAVLRKLSRNSFESAASRLKGMATGLLNTIE
jgi:glycosyltransferase involved in cell wall biosynthesis